MVKPISIDSPHQEHFKSFSHPDELLMGRTYTFLSDNVLFYKNEAGKFVVFTIDPEAEYTKEHYMQLPEGAPYQLLDGKLTHMPSPTELHQAIVQNISLFLGLFVRKHKLGIVRFAPLDVHLDEANIVQPNILFLSNERADLRQKFIMGAPDLMVEILSPGTQKIDRKKKLAKYEQHGVLEYWIVDPKKKQVEMYFAEGKKFGPKTLLGTDDTLTSQVVSGFEMPVSEIFDTEN